MSFVVLVPVTTSLGGDMEECPHCHRHFDEILMSPVDQKTIGCYDCLKAKGLIVVTDTVAA